MCSCCECADQFILSSAKFLLIISTDHGMFVIIPLFIGFQIETDLGINASTAPVGLQFGFSDCFSCFAFWRFRFGAVLIIFSSAKFYLQQSFANRFFCCVIPWVHCRDWCWGRWRLCMSLVFHDAPLAIDSLAGLVRFWRSCSPSAISLEGWICWKAGNFPMCWGMGLVMLSGLWRRRTQRDPRRRITCFLLLVSKPGCVYFSLHSSCFMMVSPELSGFQALDSMLNTVVGFRPGNGTAAAVSRQLLNPVIHWHLPFFWYHCRVITELKIGGKMLWNTRGDSIRIHGLTWMQVYCMAM